MWSIRSCCFFFIEELQYLDFEAFGLLFSLLKKKNENSVLANTKLALERYVKQSNELTDH